MLDSAAAPAANNDNDVINAAFGINHQNKIKAEVPVSLFVLRHQESDQPGCKVRSRQANQATDDKQA